MESGAGGLSVPHASDPSRGDLVCIAEVAWGYFKTRKQFLLSRLAKRWRVVYFEPLAFGRGNRWSARTEDGVLVVTVPFPKPATTVGLYNALLDRPAGRALAEGVAGAALAWRARALGIARPVCVISNVYAVNLLSALRPRLVCYDFNDHPLQFPGAPPWTQAYFSRLLERSDLVLAVSEPYRRELAERTRAPVILLENGVEFERFSRPDGPPPEDLSRLPRPRLGYVGKLSHFLDVPLLERLADGFAHPLVLAGPLPPEMRRPLEGLLARSNVHYLGERPYDEVPRFLSGLDVGLIPFRAGDRFTTRINPNKLYQYLAAGLPVVSSPIEGLAEDGAGLFFATDPETFEDRVRRALGGGIRRDELVERARSHDWDALADEMDRILVEAVPR